MKPHFGKQVIERPRRGSRNRSVKARRFGEMIDGEYYGPSRIPMTMGGKQFAYDSRLGEKEFSDVLGPVNGYLRSAVGRPWNDVYSELSKALGQFSWPLRHILTVHVDVAVNTYRGVDGNVWHCNKLGGPEVVSRPSYRDEFYVEPETGLLRMVKGKPWRWKDPKVKQLEKATLPGGRHAVRIKGLWFIGTYRKVPFYQVELRKPRPMEFTPTGTQIIVDHRAIPEWPHYKEKDWSKETWVFTKIKQASKRELREIRKLIS